MHTRKVLLAALFVVGLPLACSEDVVPPSHSDFVLRIEARDATGRPVPNLFVTAWNRLSDESLRYNSPAAATWFRFDIAQTCAVRIEVFRLDGHHYATAYDSRAALAGHHEILWTLPPSTRDAAYRCRLVCTESTSGVVLFQDSLLAYHATERTFDNIIGRTDSSGIFETRDRTLFSSLFNPGPMPLVLDRSDSLASFAVVDSVVVGLGYRSFAVDLQESHKLEPGENVVPMLWTVFSPLVGEGTGTPGRARTLKVPAPGSPTAANPPVGGANHWKFYSNWPNPF